MKVSFNELQSMSKGAARGAGFDWGYAEEVSFAVVWLSKNGFNSTKALVNLLENDLVYPPKNINEDIWTNENGDLDPIISGIALLDLNMSRNIILENVFLPFFIIPFVSQLSNPILIEANNFKVVSVNGEVEAKYKDLPLRSEKLKISMTSDNRNLIQRQASKRCEVEDDVWKRLKELTYLTYAPVTEESRMLGAGAGLSDND